MIQLSHSKSADMQITSATFSTTQPDRVVFLKEFYHELAMETRSFQEIVEDYSVNSPGFWYIPLTVGKCKRFIP